MKLRIHVVLIHNLAIDRWGWRKAEGGPNSRPDKETYASRDAAIEAAATWMRTYLDSMDYHRGEAIDASGEYAEDEHGKPERVYRGAKTTVHEWTGRVVRSGKPQS